VANGTNRLTSKEYKRFAATPVKCQVVKQRIGSLSDYFSTIAALITGAEKYWFRGHARVKWSLTPSALRYRREADRKRALKLVSEFKRVAEIKLPRPPGSEDELKWVQLAQHYGIPTRLLDWTESATIGLYFACLDDPA
jgi:FRG domain